MLGQVCDWWSSYIGQDKDVIGGSTLSLEDVSHNQSVSTTRCLHWGILK